MTASGYAIRTFRRGDEGVVVDMFNRVFGAADPKTGACGSAVSLASEAKLNHQTAFEGGVCADDCGAMLKAFFAARR